MIRSIFQICVAEIEEVREGGEVEGGGGLCKYCRRSGEPSKEVRGNQKKLNPTKKSAEDDVTNRCRIVILFSYCELMVSSMYHVANCLPSSAVCLRCDDKIPQSVDGLGD